MNHKIYHQILTNLVVLENIDQTKFVEHTPDSLRLSCEDIEAASMLIVIDCQNLHFWKIFKKYLNLMFNKSKSYNPILTNLTVFENIDQTTFLACSRQPHIIL